MKALWHFIVCRPAFSRRDAMTLSTAELLTGKAVCSCGKVCRR